MLLRAERRHCSVQNQTIDANVDATVTRCEQQTHSASTQTRRLPWRTLLVEPCTALSKEAIQGSTSKMEHVLEPHNGHPLSWAHSNVSKCPLLAALAHVSSSHSQPLSWAHFNVSKCPPSAASAHVSAFHGKLLSRAHWRTGRQPILAAHVQTSVHRLTSPLVAASQNSAQDTAEKATQQKLSEQVAWCLGLASGRTLEGFSK